MFKEALRGIVEQTDGCLAGLLMDSSGIALETYARDAAFDISTIGVEFTVVINQVKRAAEMLDAGSTQEMSVGTDKMVTVIRMLNDTYFLAIAIKPDGNLGKGRYLMRLSAPKFLAEL